MLQICFLYEAKKIWRPEFGPKGQNGAQNQVFCYFIKFGSLVFLEIAYNDSLEQCLTTSRDKTCQKNWGPNLGQIGQNWAQNQVFCQFFFQFDSLVFLEIAQDDSLEHCLTTGGSKSCAKNFRDLRVDLKLGFLPFS